MKVSTRLIAAGLTLIAGLLFALPFQHSHAPGQSGGRGSGGAEILKLPAAAAGEANSTQASTGASDQPTESPLAGDSLPMSDENAGEDSVGDADSENVRENDVDLETRRGSLVNVSPASEREHSTIADNSEEALTELNSTSPALKAPELSRRFPSTKVASEETRPLAAVEPAAAREVAEDEPVKSETMATAIASDGSSIEESSVAPPNLPTAPKFIVKRHRIRDGDTLEKLALRYLGSGERSDEIFARNRDVLADPNLLPIGKEISLLLPAELVRDD